MKIRLIDIHNTFFAYFSYLRLTNPFNARLGSPASGNGHTGVDGKIDCFCIKLLTRILIFCLNCRLCHLFGCVPLSTWPFFHQHSFWCGLMLALYACWKRMDFIWRQKKCWMQNKLRQSRAVRWSHDLLIEYRRLYIVLSIWIDRQPISLDEDSELFIVCWRTFEFPMNSSISLNLVFTATPKQYLEKMIKFQMKTNHFNC